MRETPALMTPITNLAGRLVGIQQILLNSKG